MRLVLIVRGFTDHDAGVKIAKAKPAPFNAAHITNLLHVQQRDPILITRPHPTRGPPVTIYEPTFAHFRHNVKRRIEIEIPSDNYRMVGVFLVTSLSPRVISTQANARDRTPSSTS